MRLHTYRTTFTILMLSLALPAWGGEYILYSPQPVTAGQEAASHDGILVKELEIRKGDTLYDLSRKFSGHGMYFPQILLFNSIKNPNMIYAGKSLKVPVTRAETSASDQIDNKPTATARKHKKNGAKNRSLATAVHETVTHQSPESAPLPTTNAELSLRDLKTSVSDKSRSRRNGKKAATHAKKNHSETVPATRISAQPAPPEAADGQQLFEAAATAYRRGDCRNAIELLDRFLSTNAGSPLAADADLYKADCFLKLSGQQ